MPVFMVDNDSEEIPLNKYFSQYLMIFGSISMVLGVIIFVRPVTTITATAYFLGVVLLFVGICQSVYAFKGHKSITWRVMYGICGFFAFILGAGALTNPDPAYAVDLLATYIGFVWVLRGISALVLAFQIKELQSEVVLFLVGIVGVLAGLGILASPLVASITLTFLVTYTGVLLFITGICEVVGALIKNKTSII